MGAHPPQPVCVWLPPVIVYFLDSVMLACLYDQELSCATIPPSETKSKIY